jgi:hypothetical protein
VAQEYGTFKRRINSNLESKCLNCYARNLLNCEQLAAMEPLELWLPQGTAQRPPDGEFVPAEPFYLEYLQPLHFSQDGHCARQLS